MIDGENDDEAFQEEEDLRLEVEEFCASAGIPVPEKCRKRECNRYLPPSGEPCICKLHASVVGFGIPQHRCKSCKHHHEGTRHHPPGWEDSWAQVFCMKGHYIAMYTDNPDDLRFLYRYAASCNDHDAKE